uniref:hypothetical protein n=1 Tax=Chamaesiphon sp. OTE_20_metabat_361 TaxID=2964689 RepID=UPI00286B9970
GGDENAGGDEGGDEKNLIATRETSSPQAIRRQGGDGGDKHFSCSKQDRENRSMLKVGDLIRYVGSRSRHK